MHEQQEQDPFSQHGLEQTRLFEAVSKLDAAERAYWDSCTNYSEKPTYSKLRLLDESVSSQIAAYYEYSAASINKELSLKEFEEQLTNQLGANEDRRVSFLNTLVSKDSIESSGFNLEETYPFANTEIPGTLEEQQQIVANLVLEAYQVFLTADTNEFIRLVEELPSAKRTEMLNNAKKHLTDVGKIVLGASVALVLTRGFRKKPLST